MNTRVKTQFTEKFGDNQTSIGNADMTDTLLSNDETTIFVSNDRDTFGVINFAEYTDNSGWSMGYTEIDDSTVSVYVFSNPNHTGQIVINADKLETVAKILDLTPATVANRVQVYQWYPVVIPSEHGRFVIAPIAKDDVTLEN